MNIFKIHIITFILLIWSVSTKSQKRVNDYGIKYELAFSINPTVHSGVVTYAVLGIDTLENKIVRTRQIDEATFVLYCKGIYKTKANPKRINLFKKYDIDCGVIIEPIMKKGVLVNDTLWEEMKPLCLPIYDIWKLKYAVHPHYPKAATNIPDEDKGWAAQRYLPSAKQSQLLQQYGGKSVSDFFYGDGMFRLFKDMQDWDWIETYKGLLD